MSVIDDDAFAFISSSEASLAQTPTCFFMMVALRSKAQNMWRISNAMKPSQQAFASPQRPSIPLSAAIAWQPAPCKEKFRTMLAYTSGPNIERWRLAFSGVARVGVRSRIPRLRRLRHTRNLGRRVEPGPAEPSQGSLMADP